MRFSELALYLGRLEETSSRNALVGILAELFGRTSPEDVAPTCYLLQGRLAPVSSPSRSGSDPTTWQMPWQGLTAATARAC